MESAKSRKSHIMMIPYPLQGHVIPFVHLAIKLASHGFTITFVNTESVHHNISTAHQGDEGDIFSAARSSGQLDIRYTTVTDGFPLGFDRSLNHDQFFEGILHVFSAHVDDLIAKLSRQDDHPVTCLIADTFYVWSSMICDKHNLVNVSFWTEPALVLNLYYHMDLLISNGHFKCLENREDVIDYVPGVKAIEPKDLMSYLQVSDKDVDTNTTVYQILSKAFKDVKRADYVLCNTVQELEPDSLSALQAKQPVYAIGPVFSTDSVVPTSLWAESDCTEWLKGRPTGSVLYVSFGSYAHVGKKEIVEIAHGLLLSRISFIWVLRPDIVGSDVPDFLPDGFVNQTQDRGLVVQWCCQMAVISNPAVGGFFTHCGWNSILESVWCGLPLLCYPLLTDQFTNRKLVVDDWRIGINLYDDNNNNKTITRDQVSGNIRRLMVKGETSSELRNNVEKVKRHLKDAVTTVGSSETNFKIFVDKMSVLVRLTSKIASLAKSGRIASARQVFDEMPERDTVAWNTMLTSYSRLGLYQEAMSLFTQLRFSDAKPDDYSFTAILSTCASLSDVSFGRKVQSLVIRSGYGGSLPVNNSLIDMYGKCSDTLSANKVFRDMGNDSRNEVTWCSLLFAYMNAEQFEAAFDVFVEMPKRVAFAWNIMISGHSQCGKIDSCLRLFKEMIEKSEFEPDCYTFSSLMNACGDSSDLVCGRMVHAVMVKNGWDCAVEAKNSVLSFYAKVGCRDDAMRVLESVEVLTQVSWNSVIDVCMKIGETEKALEVFHLAPERNIVTWTTMIAGYGRNGDGEQALRFFVEMMKSEVDSDHFAYGAVLHACSGLACLGHGKMIHGCLIHRGFQGYAYVGNALVNLYAKCGDIKESNRAFGDIADKDLVSWNTMLFAFGVHGLADQALKLYDSMIASGIKPDKVTFIGLLTTCSHSGLVEEGCSIFESMVRDYGIPLEVDHVTCMIDMFGRGGYLEEAKDLATTYNSLITKASNSSSWEALLGACSTHWHTELGREVSKVLKIAEPSEEMSFVLLSNLYCSSGRWKEAEDVRREMVERGMKKTPGCSWIEVGNQVSTFLVGDSTHPRLEELSETLNSIQSEMRNPETFWNLWI